MRDKASQEFSSQAGQYDVATLSNFEIPFYSKNGWLAPLDSYIGKDTGFDQADIFPADRQVADRLGRQGLRRAVLRRVVVPDVPQGRVRGQAPDHAGQPDLEPGRRPGREGRRGQAGHEGHLPARPARLGRGAGPADHRGQHVRRHLVHKNWTAQVDAPRSQEATNFYINLVKQHGEAARAVRVHRVPERLPAGQGGHVVRRHLGGGLPGGPARRWPARSATCRRRSRRPSPRAGCTPGPGPSRRPARTRTAAWKFISWASGKELRAAWSARSSAGPRSRRASVTSTYSNPDYLKAAARVRQADDHRDRQRRPQQPRRAAAADGRHPVRRRPRVHRLRDQGVAAGQQGDSGPDRVTNALKRPEAGVGRRQELTQK